MPASLFVIVVVSLVLGPTPGVIIPVLVRPHFASFSISGIAYITVVEKFGALNQA
jgi:hypothetical protein